MLTEEQRVRRSLNPLGNSAHKPMPSLRKRSNFLSKLRNRLLPKVAVAAALAGFFLHIIRADQTPAQTLQSRFESAKSSLAAGNLVSAENHYLDAITLGLRQMAQLSISAAQIDRATADLEQALSLRPDDSEIQVALADAWFRKGEVPKVKKILQAVVATQPSHARARGLLGRIYVFEGDSEAAIEELKSSADLEEDFETDYFLGI